MNGHVYVMGVVGSSTLCKVGVTQRTIKDRFGKGMRYRDHVLTFYGWHWFEDCAVAEREVHSLLSWCRSGDAEIFEIEPVGAFGALLWYACELAKAPDAPRRQLRLYRTATIEAAKERRCREQLRAA